MISFPYIEDYLEVIAGKKGLPGQVVLTASWMGLPFAPIINLARYDNGFLDSVTDATTSGKALTDRQAELAIKLVNKYARQLSKHNIQVDISEPRYRHPLRIIDRTRSLEFDGKNITFKFPFDNHLIDQIRTLSKESHGRVRFDKDARVWRIAPTEYNINWAYTFAKTNNFNLAAEVEEVMNQIVAVEATSYAICLRPNMQIENASQSLVNYVNEHLGGFEDNNLIRLVDYAPILGYTVDEQILYAIGDNIDGSTVLMLNNRDYNFNNAEDAVERIVRYADVANRWPIFVFNPTAESTLEEWAAAVGKDSVLSIANKKWEPGLIEPHHRVIYSHKPIKYFDRIPLLVTHAGMMIGYEKQAMYLAAEKIFFTGVKLKA